MGNITSEEMLRDLSLVRECLTKKDKAKIAEKYGIQSCKSSDICNAILAAAHDDRSSRSEFSSEDIRLFLLQGSEPSKIGKLLESEPVEFAKLVCSFLLGRVKKRKVEHLLKVKMNSYNSSAADRYLVSQYLRAAACVEKMQDQSHADNERLMFTKIDDEISGYRKSCVDEASEKSRALYLSIPSKITKSHVKEDEARVEFSNAMKSNDTKAASLAKQRVDSIIKTRVMLESIKKNYTLDEYVTKAINDTNSKIDAEIHGIAKRLENREIDAEKMHCSNVASDPKLIRMTITDGTHKLYCRSILCASDSCLMATHLRFIMTECKAW